MVEAVGLAARRRKLTERERRFQADLDAIVQTSVDRVRVRIREVLMPFRRGHEMAAPPAGDGAAAAGDGGEG